MRKAFVETLAGCAAMDDRIVLMTGDLGFRALEPFADRHPKRFFNVGVAEQNMVGMATGLAEAGFIPFVYSIATFATLRPYEFIRNGPVLHSLPVRVVGVGGGFEYGTGGPTHFALEDVAVMRTQPGMCVFVPADAEQAASIVRATWNLPGPIYYRIGKNEHESVPGLRGAFEIERVQVVREGRDVVFLTLGPLATEAVAAADLLERSGISAAVAVVASVSPAPVEDLARLSARFPLVISVEAHYVNGGLGSLVSEIVAARPNGCRVLRCGVRTLPDGRSGSEAWHRRRHGLSAEQLAGSVIDSL
jgi:transketolase